MPGITGIGMGLTVAVTNVRAMGGTLSLATSPTATAEQGVTIIIRLPFDEGQGHSDSASERIRRRTQLLPIKTLR
jgi:K+-sensing histidine kinase KdpD